MNRLALVSSALLCASTFACASAGNPPPILALPAGCDQGPVGSHDLTVNDDATVSQDCLGIHRGQTELAWKGPTDARYLFIVFKDAAANGNSKVPPADPWCSGRKCTLKKSKTALIEPTTANEMGYLYSVVVVLKSGKVATLDPRLIIQP